MIPSSPARGRLDHELYDARIASRAAARCWPDGHAAAMCIVVHVEAFEIDAPKHALRDPGMRGDFGSFFPDYRAHSLIEYGNRIGVFRLLDLLQPAGWRVAVAVDGLIAKERPSLVRSLEERGLEILASGWSASRMITSAMPVEEEYGLLQQSADAVAQSVGHLPKGYSSQDYGYSTHTAGLLEGLGFGHAVDWPNDEIPYAFGPRRKLVMLPAAAELDDAQAMLVRKLQPREWGAALGTALDWWEAHALPGSILALPLHAWVAGAAHRTPALRRALAAHAANRFWQASPAEVAAQWRAETSGS